MINLTETGRIKDLLDERPQDYKSIIDSAKVGICITNADGNYVAVNQLYCDIYGWTEEEFIGNSFLMVVPEEAKQKLKDLHDTFIQREFEILRSWVVKRKNGEEVEIFVDATFSNQINGAPHKVTFVEEKK